MKLPEKLTYVSLNSAQTDLNFFIRIKQHCFKVGCSGNPTMSRMHQREALANFSETRHMSGKEGMLLSLSVENSKQYK